MLSRPHAHAAPGITMAERAQLATLFGLIGSVLGMLAVAAGLWLFQLHQTIQGQSKDLQELAAALDRAQARKTLDVTLAGVQAKQAALDALLREVKPGSSPEAFTDLYAGALRDRDEAQTKLAEQKAAADLALADLVRQKDANDKAAREVAELRKRSETLEKAAREASDLRATAKEQAAEIKTLRRAVEEQDEKLATLKDIQAGTLPRKYEIAWYSAVAGWGLCILAGLGVLALLGRTPPPAEAESPA